VAAPHPKRLADRDDPGLRLLAIAEAAQSTSLSRMPIRAISSGEITASLLRGRLRVRLSDLERWFEVNAVTALPAGFERMRRMHGAWRTWCQEKGRPHLGEDGGR
jgi:hypothetical protein